MKSLKDYILEDRYEELPDPLWDLDELEKYDADVDKKVKRDVFSKEKVEEIPASELSGNDNKGALKIGDIIYKDLIRPQRQTTGKDIYDQPYMISDIRKADKPNQKWNRDEGKYLITGIDAAGKYAIDVAQNWNNTMIHYN